MEQSATVRITGSERAAIPGMRWWVLVLLCLFMILNYADRAALSVAAPSIMWTLDIDLASFGTVLSIFYLGYAPFAFIGGWTSDKWGIRKVFALSAAWWSIFTALTAVGSSLVGLCILRALFGAGEGPSGTLTAKAVNSWFPQREMGTAFSVTVAAQPLGGAVTVPFVVALIELSGGNWRIPFLVLGALGLLLAAGWYAVARDLPEQHGRVSPSELSTILSGPLARTPLEPTLKPAVPISAQLKRPEILGTAVSFFAYAWVLYVILAWLPTYLLTARHLKLSDLSWAGSLPWIAGVVGSMAGGTLADGLIRRTGAAAAVRKWLLVAGLAIGSVGLVIVVTAASLIVAVIIFSVILFALYIAGAQFFPLIAAVVPARQYGGIAGALHGFANIAGFFAPAVTGFLVQHAGSWALAFFLAGGLGIVGAFLMAVVGKAAAQSGRPE